MRSVNHAPELDEDIELPPSAHTRRKCSAVVRMHISVVLGGPTPVAGHFILVSVGSVQSV